MAQFSWKVIESKPASLHSVLESVEKCNNDISLCLHSSSHKTRILSQLETFLQSVREISEDPSFKQYIETLPSLEFLKTTGVVQIHPSYLGNVNSGIYAYLSNFLMHYNDDFSGVWISCGDIVPLDSLGYLTTGDYQGLVSLRISLRVLAFIPKLDVIIGKISRIRPRSISVLAYGIFNVSVKPENLPEIKQENSEYSLVCNGKTVSENALLTLQLIGVNVLKRNKWLNLSAKLHNVTE
ncbi:SHS2 domain found in N terminus of Rpb7p/Rpc25p/MJ0397 family protein [Theileria parva strain Muguga]|uniref:SHS2 domain found in N terminus of Rpb7p/Rpc25p/MJ0397 family protein n=1 Tax=Theileria parva strain Muguga TaxID=333668 RepID=UPI001C61FD09|nr:SHS2 domain found in N terminus of Rpb7p/Rpc25p/MJ0397 family protein [Theileria parva strain Muguga]EAN32993.2 SHS2 domain found in N terminus of Rpb7p/Rpc25p/MJ0397 family protein [Theileria parva strain Muguga]